MSFGVTDWDLSSIGADDSSALSFALKVGGGKVPFEFSNPKSGGVEKFNAHFVAAGFSFPLLSLRGTGPPPWLKLHGTRLVTTPLAPDPFPIGTIRGNFGIICSLGGISHSAGVSSTRGSVGYIVFSYSLLGHGPFAACAFAMPSQVFGETIATAIQFIVK